MGLGLRERSSSLAMESVGVVRCGIQWRNIARAYLQESHLENSDWRVRVLVEYLQCSWFVYFYLLFIEIKGHPAQRTPPYFLQPIFLQPTSNCRKETNQQQEIRNSEVAKKWPKQHATQPIAFQRSDIVATPIVLFFFCSMALVLYCTNNGKCLFHCPPTNFWLE